MEHALHIDPTGMTAPQLLEAEIIFMTYLDLMRDGEITSAVNINAENIGEVFEQFQQDHDDYMYENMYALRESGKPSNIKCEQYSRYYELEEVAYQTKTGHWIGWTYWHGGGKHGEPEDIDWIPHAYFLDIVAEKQVIEYQFARKQ